MFKKGELDYFAINRAKEWVEELNYDGFQRGCSSRRRSSTTIPRTSVLCLQHTARTLGRIRVRKAMTLLFNRNF